MRFLKTKNQYKASNFLYEVDGKKSWSYNWWLFSIEIDGKLLFNNTHYSITTSAHQSKAHKLIGYTTPKYYSFHHTKTSLSNLEQAFKDELEGIKKEIKDLVYLINKKGTRKAKNEQRKLDITYYLKKIEIVIEKAKGLGYDISEYRNTGLDYSKSCLSELMYKDQIILPDLL